MRYDGVFEKKRSVWICIVIVPCVAFVIASIPSFPFNHTCGQFLFSRVRYDIMPKGCEDWEPGYPEMQSQAYATIITWAVLTFSALATDVLTMIRLIFLAKKTTAEKNFTVFYRNVRFFLQTFFLNIVICCGVIATHVVSEHFTSNFERFWFAQFQVLLGFALNGQV
uniref:7TM_GPCR_Srx domain-containing protein n=1 Tax=Steinernema glaseri TaxID=37863 RepID=A0A1I7YM78_9BILA